MGRALRGSAAVALVLGLSGCAGTDAGDGLNAFGSTISGGWQSLTSGELFSGPYLQDRSDSCIEQRRAMASQGSFFDKRLVAATATGAVAGGLIAAVSGQNVVAGSLIGGATGLAGGYLLKMQGQGLDSDTIIGHAFNDVQAENQKIDALLASFRTLKECRLQQGREIRQAYASNTIDKSQAETQMAAVRTKYNEDVAKFEQVAHQIAENSSSYTAVYNEVAADNSAQALEVRDYQKGRSSVRVTRKQPKRIEGVQAGSLQTADRANVQKLQDECLTNVRKRDECIEEIQASQKETEQLDLG